MSRLLDKPLKAFTIYALLILLCSVPVYYLVVDYIWLDELDKHNHISKALILERLSKSNPEEVPKLIYAWNTLQQGSSLDQEQKPAATEDSMYTINRVIGHSNSHEKIERFRGLSSHLIVHKNYYHLRVETNVEEADETIVAIASVTACFFTLLIIGFILLNRKIAKGIWQPFQDTLHKLNSFDLSRQNFAGFTKSDTQEFEELNQSLQKLIDKNISVYNQQKRFTENASHELQTPLAILRSKIDLLLQNGDLTSGQSEILNSIHLPLSRVSRITKNLLLLAKIENSQFEETENINISDSINDSVELLTDYINDKHLHLSFTFEQPLSVFCNKFLMETLINNLLTNAIRHNTEGGKIIIELSRNQLTFSNSGNLALDQNTLFQRFSISSSRGTNSGLGLAIVKEICNRYRWRVQYSYPGQHCFTVNF